jgi:hypothetical protein
MFTTKLAELLTKTQVINLGVSGYSTDQELLLYQDEGRKYRADIVIVVVAANDRPGNDRTVEYIVSGKPKYVIRHGKLELINQPVAKTSWLKHTAVSLTWRSFVLSQFHRVLYQSGVTQAHPQALTGEPEDGEIVDSNGAKYKLAASLNGWQITLQLLLEMKHLVEKDGAKLLIVFTDGLGFAAAREMRELFKSLDIDTLFLDDYLNANDRSLHLPDMLHWSSAGNKIVASAVANKVKGKFSNDRYQQ